MLNEQDFDILFSAFNATNTGSGIKEVYNIMPYASEQQIKIYLDALYFAEKYDIPEIEKYVKNVMIMKKENRPLGFMPSVKNFLKYATLDEKVRNVKVQSTNISGAE